MVHCNFWDIQRRPNQLICETCKKLAHLIQDRSEFATFKYILQLNVYAPKVYIQNKNL